MEMELRESLVVQGLLGRVGKLAVGERKALQMGEMLLMRRMNQTLTQNSEESNSRSTDDAFN
jgi:hypothetical protein